ncbi:MAG: hypothetical protein IJJ33_08820 [Victivallales bacterium]|nr:hypothetical protein [Victivallales bacterium]
MKKETLDYALKTSWWDEEPLTEKDLSTEKWRMIFGLGYALWGDREPLGEIFGQGGMGGSEGYMDRRKNIIVAYTCSVDRQRLIEQIFHAVGFQTRHHRGVHGEIADRKTKSPSQP